MAFTIGVVGASGGVGASTLAAAVAVRASTVVEDCPSVLLLDLDVRGGLDTTMCLEHLEGTRWTDVQRQGWPEETTPGPVRLGDLPNDDGVFVLAGRGRPWPDDALVTETFDDLSSQADLVVVDAGPRPAAPLLSRLDLLLVMVRLSTKGIRDAQALSRACVLARSRPRLVSRGAKGDRAGPSAARQLGLDHLAHCPDDPRVPRQASEGLAPGVLRTSVDAVADEALALMEASWLLHMVGRAGALSSEGWAT